MSLKGIVACILYFELPNICLILFYFYIIFSLKFHSKEWHFTFLQQIKTFHLCLWYWIFFFFLGNRYQWVEPTKDYYHLFPKWQGWSDELWDQYSTRWRILFVSVLCIYKPSIWICLISHKQDALGFITCHLTILLLIHVHSCCYHILFAILLHAKLLRW